MLLWKPSPERIDQANLTRFIQAVQASRGVPVNDYPSLYRWSIEDPEGFWTAVWEFTGIIHSRKWDQVMLRGETMAQTQWFPGARLNFAENLLRHRDERPALVFWNELGRQSMLSWAELYCAVARLAKALRARGIQRGDRVAGFLPNVPAAVIAMLAATSIGAIWSSCSPDFGVKGVLDRFNQIQPKVLFTTDGGLYAGKKTDPLHTIARIVPQIAAIEQVVVLPSLESTPGISLPEKATLYPDFVGNVPESEIEFEQLPFSHPLYIVYSSGTSGAPKCIVHGAGGTLIQHLKELVLHTDLKSESRIFYYTTCGWMMWNWLVSSLATGATVVLYDGSPFHPREDILFDMAQQEQLTVFGTSAKYLALARKKGLEPRKTHSLPSLRTILSTGSPLAPASFDYVYQEVKPEVCLSSISGGTDLISCFATGNPIGPVYRSELQVRGLGMKVEVYDPVWKIAARSSW
ncbi:MAG: acetoacetate--CoA ligase [Acidobacteriota bacterium]